jgi:hypothetical protein
MNRQVRDARFVVGCSARLARRIRRSVWLNGLGLREASCADRVGLSRAFRALQIYAGKAGDGAHRL